MPALTRVRDRAVSEIGTAITADNATMPMIDPTPNRSEKKIMRLGRDVVYRHEIYME
jgi:hypothetical protein